VQYYRDHKEDYVVPAKVNWQLLVIEFDKHGGLQGAGQQLKAAVAELKAGTEFTEVVKNYSDSLTKLDGGHWKGTTKGSLSDQKVEAALFELPVGQISAPIQSETSLKLVKVISRDEERTIPFGKAQNEIEKIIQEERMKAASEKVLAELHENAVVETIFDEPDPSKQSEIKRPSLQGFFE